MLYRQMISGTGSPEAEQLSVSVDPSSACDVNGGSLTNRGLSNQTKNKFGIKVRHRVIVELSI